MRGLNSIAQITCVAETSFGSRQHTFYDDQAVDDAVLSNTLWPGLVRLHGELRIRLRNCRDARCAGTPPSCARRIVCDWRLGTLHHRLVAPDKMARITVQVGAIPIANSAVRSSILFQSHHHASNNTNVALNPGYLRLTLAKHTGARIRLRPYRYPRMMQSTRPHRRLDPPETQCKSKFGSHGIATGVWQACKSYASPLRITQ